jgi:hypothetical protein
MGKATMNDFHCHHGRVSGNSSRVAFALHEMGARYVSHVVDTQLLASPAWQSAVKLIFSV